MTVKLRRYYPEIVDFDENDPGDDYLLSASSLDDLLNIEYVKRWAKNYRLEYFTGKSYEFLLAVGDNCKYIISFVEEGSLSEFDVPRYIN